MVTWAVSHDLDSTPVKLYQFALHPQHLAEQSRSKATVEEAWNALSWIHSIAGLVPPLVESFVKVNLESMKLTPAESVVQKSLSQWTGDFGGNCPRC